MMRVETTQCPASVNESFHRLKKPGPSSTLLGLVWNPPQHVTGNARLAKTLQRLLGKTRKVTRTTSKHIKHVLRNIASFKILIHKDTA